MTIGIDPCFPQTPKIYDMGLMARIFQDNLFADSPFDSSVVESCKIKNQRHKAGKNFVIAFDLVLFNTQTGRRQQQVVSGRFCRGGLGLLELSQERERHQNKTGTQSAVLYLPEVELMAWVFPQDRKLVHLARIMDEAFLKTYLNVMLPLLDCAADSHIDDVQMEVLHYLPERSCMIRYRLTIKDPTQATKQHKIIYGKNYRDNYADETHAIMCQLAMQLPKTAISLGYDEQLRTLWQSHLSGIPLVWGDLETLNAASLLKAMAACVAKFQGCKIKTARRYGFAEIDEQLFDTITAADAQDKLLAKQLSVWVSALMAKREALSWAEQPAFPLHQDLHLGNFMMDGDDLCLIDMDTVCLGDPLADIGSLVANFYSRGFNAGRDVAYVDAIVEQFLRNYRASVSWKVEYSQLNWFIAATFVHEVIRRSLRKRHETGLEQIKIYLELSKRYAGLIPDELEHV